MKEAYLLNTHLGADRNTLQRTGRLEGTSLAAGQQYLPEKSLYTHLMHWPLHLLPKGHTLDYLALVAKGLPFLGPIGL